MVDLFRVTSIGWPVGFFLNRFNDCELCTRWKATAFSEIVSCTVPHANNKTL